MSWLDSFKLSDSLLLLFFWMVLLMVLGCLSYLNALAIFAAPECFNL
jgi:hypothetical protein